MKKLILVLAAIILLCGCSGPVYAQFHGLKIAEPYQIDEIQHFSNSFAFWPESTDSLREILDYNQGRLLPFIEMARYFFNSEKGIYEWRDIAPIKQALKNDKIVITLDEPLWHVRKGCGAGSTFACAEIESNYKTTQAIFTRLKYELGYQMAHIESYQEIVWQKEASPDENVIIIKSADQVGFNCYGHFDSCKGHPQMKYGQWVYDAIKDTGKKMLLVAGAFDFDGVRDQLIEYFNVYKQYKEIFSGLGVFTWGDSNGIKGARDYPDIAAEVERLMLEIKLWEVSSGIQQDVPPLNYLEIVDEFEKFLLGIKVE
jgi:hypothetical protein